MKKESIHNPAAGQPGWAGTPPCSALRRGFVPHWLFGVAAAGAMALAVPASADITYSMSGRVGTNPSAASIVIGQAFGNNG